MTFLYAQYWRPPNIRAHQALLLLCSRWKWWHAIGIGALARVADYWWYLSGSGNTFARGMLEVSRKSYI